MNEYYEPYLAHWRPKGSKNGMHLFGIAQNPNKYANGTATAGLMAEWNKRQQRAGEWDAWGKYQKGIANGGLNNKNVSYVDENGNVVSGPSSEKLQARAQKRYEDATRRANIHRAKANQLIDTLGQETLGSLYNTPLKHVYRTYFKTAAKVYNAGGIGKYIKQSAGQALKNIGGMATKFKNLLTGKSSDIGAAANPITLREERKAAARRKKNRRASVKAVTERGKRMTEYYSNPTAYRAKERSRLYRTNSKYLPTAVPYA